ncbi:unnamed protein product [Brassicogethes aeneus]|uniref:CIDE-N domain-containing protein n=1 Tax=Brassicogethes aeneus TaxID=1431903 RepID=A0A9P0B1L5_BRAAE|nr:unnamed protein product [Brassicogethes aeneus]
MDKENGLHNASHIFKIWDSSRKNKILVIARSSNIYQQVILKASQKLNVNGVSLVIEKDGTRVDEDEELIMVKDDPLILLEKDQFWVAENSLHPNPTSIEETQSLAQIITEAEIDLNLNEIQNMPLVIFDQNSEMFWKEFNLWKHVSLKNIENLENGVRTSNLTKEVIRNVVDGMREIKTIIPCKAFKIVASRMVDKYKQSFQAHDEENVILGNGYDHIYCKLLDRNNYLNRPNKRNTEHVEVPSKKRKTLANARVGCLNWQPSLIPTDALEKKEKLREITPDSNQFIPLMEDTFALQRTNINSSTQEIKEIFEEWPGLLTKEGIFTHFKILTNVNPYEIECTEKSIKIKKFGEKNKIPVSEPANLKNALKVVSQHFKEDFLQIFYKVKNGDVENPVNILSPAIVEIEHDESNVEYIVQLENLRSNPVNDFESAFLMTFALYFIFGLEYPKKNACTFEFIQRYFFKIHQESGTKSSIKNVKNKVFNLILKLSNF